MRQGDLLKVSGETGLFEFIKHDADMGGVYVVCEQGGREYRFDLEKVERYGDIQETSEKLLHVHEMISNNGPEMTFDQLCQVENLINGFFRK